MSLSQFTFYSSLDTAGPGALTGLTGSLISVLDACLVNGYTGKPAAGWTKPFANSGSVFGCWKQGSGSLMTLFVNDAGYGAAIGKEAWATGWENLTQIGPSGTGSVHVGVGQNQFPLPAQSLTQGRVVWRKSATTDNTVRQWVIAADPSTFYLWVQSDTILYKFYSFGDLYSLRGASDMWKCMIIGRGIDNSAVNSTSGVITDMGDVIAQTTWNAQGNWITVAQTGHFLARNAFGAGGSTTCVKRGDGSIAGSLNSLNGFGVNSQPINGVLPLPMMDGTMYMCPLTMIEPGSGAQGQQVLRGKIRALYHVGHASTSFYDGQIISGSGDYSGKMFTIVWQSAAASYWAVENTPTVDTN